MSDTSDLIMAAYQSVDTARGDFDHLVRLIKDKAVRSDGVIVVARAEEGRVTVVETGDHFGRKGWGGVAALDCSSASSRPPCSVRSPSVRPLVASSASSRASG